MATLEEIDALVEAKLKEMTAELEAKLEAVTKNRDSILREKRQLEGRLLDRAADRLIKGEQAPAQPTDRVIVPRRADPATYRSLKAEAERRGVPLVFDDGSASDPTMAVSVRSGASKVTIVETDSTYYANQALQRKVGLQALTQDAAAKNKPLRIFRSADDLDPEGRAKHDRILAAGDPDHLVFEG